VTVSLFAGASALILPAWAGGAEHVPPPHFAVPERGPMPPHELLGHEARRELRRDAESGRVEVIGTASDGHRLLDDGLTYTERERDVMRITDGAPLSAMVECEREFAVGRGEWQVTVRTTSSMSATAASFGVRNTLDGYEGGLRVFTKTWHADVPRDGV
jgi:uncharacterized protein